MVEISSSGSGEGLGGEIPRGYSTSPSRGLPASFITARVDLRVMSAEDPTSGVPAFDSDAPNERAWTPPRLVRLAARAVGRQPARLGTPAR